MKYFIFCITLLMLMISDAKAGYIEDVKNLGYVSGEGLACGAKKYKKYEFIARAYLISAAKSDEEQAEGEYEYNSAKARAYLSKRHVGMIDCPETNERFNEQKIFDTIVYKTGKLKMPDGKIIKPREKYDVMKVYDLSDDEKARVDEKYQSIVAKRKKQAQREGIYQKIKQAELKNRN